MRFVVLDTTAFYPYSATRPPALERLFVGGSRYELRLRVPEVVIREVTRHFSRGASPAYNRFKDGFMAARQAGMLPPELSDVELKRPNKAEVVAAFERNLREAIRRVHGKVLPLPEVDHEWVLRRIFGPLKPSKADEDSYRDILIWKSVVELAGAHQDEDVIFITNNTADFAEKGTTDLHEELKEDLRIQNIHPDSVIIMRTPDDYVQAHLAAGDELRNQLEKFATEDGPARDELKEVLRVGLEGAALDDVRMALPAEGEIDDRRVETVNDISDIAVSDIYDIGDDEYSMSLRVVADVDVYYTVTAPTGYDLEFAPRWDIDGVDAGAPFLMNTEPKDLALDIEITWQSNTREWGEVEVSSGHEVDCG